MRSDCALWSAGPHRAPKRSITPASVAIPIAELDPFLKVTSRINASTYKSCLHGWVAHVTTLVKLYRYFGIYIIHIDEIGLGEQEMSVNWSDYKEHARSKGVMGREFFMVHSVPVASVEEIQQSLL